MVQGRRVGIEKTGVRGQGLGEGIGNNSQGYRDKTEASYSGDLFLIVPAGPYGNVYFRGDVGWTEFPIPDIRDKRLELTIGKMNPTALFDGNTVANSETNQFLADIFVNDLALEFGGKDRPV